MRIRAQAEIETDGLGSRHVQRDNSFMIVERGNTGCDMAP
jgi:hypothetical protein